MKRPNFSRLRSLFPTLAGALLGVVVVLAYLQLNPPGGRYNDTDIAQLAQERIDAITPTPPLEPELYALVRPSVVLITNEGPGVPGGRSVGSGVVVDREGVILTAYHVVANARTVNVRFFDGTTATGTVAQTQPERDLATINVPGLPQTVDAATLAGGVRPGDRVLAIGAPLGLDGSVSSGIVSALGRRFSVQETGMNIDNMIQFDAAVNPGSSGGPLVDMSGRVVGIVSGLVNPTSDRVFIGLGFAVPIESAGGILPPQS